MTIPREAIDIEALLVRAYREKRVDRYGRDGRAAGAAALGLGSGPRAPGSQLGGPERVDTSSYAANSAARSRDALLQLAGTADGLLALHDAVLALPDMFVDYGAGADFLVWDAETAAGLGHRITLTGDRATIQAVRRRGGRGPGRDDLLPAGESRAVTRVVTSVLVIRHGREMSRPDLSDVVETRRPVYAGPNSRRVVSHEIEYRPSLDLVAGERATYAVWRAALGLLVEARKGCTDYAITGPHAPATPWERIGGVVLPSRKGLARKGNFKAPPDRGCAA